MISFCSMPENHYPGYLKYFIPDYANEIQENHRLSPGTALARADDGSKEIHQTIHQASQ